MHRTRGASNSHAVRGIACGYRKTPTIAIEHASSRPDSSSIHGGAARLAAALRASKHGRLRGARRSDGTPRAYGSKPNYTASSGRQAHTTHNAHHGDLFARRLTIARHAHGHLYRYAGACHARAKTSDDCAIVEPSRAQEKQATTINLSRVRKLVRAAGNHPGGSLLDPGNMANGI